MEACSVSADLKLRVLELVVKSGSEKDKQDPLTKADQWFAWVTSDGAGDKADDAEPETVPRPQPRQRQRRRRHGGQPETARETNG
jgi:hypothetical protein